MGTGNFCFPFSIFLTVFCRLDPHYRPPERQKSSSPFFLLISSVALRMYESIPFLVDISPFLG